MTTPPPTPTSTQTSPPSTSPAEADVLQLGAVERWRRAFRALARVLQNPEETDQVLSFSTYANAGTMQRRHGQFLDHPEGRMLFEQRRAIDSRTVDLAALGALPEGTLGRAYAQFLTSRGLTPDVFDGPPADVHDPESAYVIQRMRQTHDLWHVVTGYETDPAGEIALQAFTFAQVRAPSTLILSVAGTMRGLSERPTLPREVVRAFRAGERAQPLVAFPWEDHWSTPLTEVRERLGLPRDGTAGTAGEIDGTAPDTDELRPTVVPLDGQVTPRRRRGFRPLVELRRLRRAARRERRDDRRARRAS